MAWEAGVEPASPIFTCRNPRPNPRAWRSGCQVCVRHERWKRLIALDALAESADAATHLVFQAEG